MAFTKIAQVLRSGFTALIIAVTLCGQAAAQNAPRPIPESSLRGTIQPAQAMLVTIDGKLLQLAPGANIRDRNNFIIVPNALPPNGALADYVVDANGQIFRVWLLTEEEAARPKKRPAR